MCSEKGSLLTGYTWGGGRQAQRANEVSSADRKVPAGKEGVTHMGGHLRCRRF